MANEDNKLPEMKEFDFIEFFLFFSKRWRKLVKFAVGGFVFGAVIAFSTPKQFDSSIMLAPESSGSSLLSGLSSIVSMAGVSDGFGGKTGDETFSVAIYPEITKSIPFAQELLTTKVSDAKEGINTTLYEYLKNGQKSTWWGACFKAVGKGLSWVISKIKGDKEEPDAGMIVKGYPTKEQLEVIKSVGDMISVDIDKKTYLVTITVSSQNAKISADLADTITVNLQKYITSYKTQKARRDMAYIEKLYKQAYSDYMAKSREYAAFSDENFEVVLNSVKMKQTSLENEMQLAYNVYSGLSQQLQLARGRVQERSSSFVVVQPPTKAYKATKPKKVIIALTFLLLGTIVGCIRVWMKDRVYSKK